MAAGMVSKPGGEYGPCKGACEHRDCQASRETAACVCRVCIQPIGYETYYFDEWYDAPKNEMGVAPKGRYGYFVHERCAYREAHQRWQAAARG